MKKLFIALKLILKGYSLPLILSLYRFGLLKSGFIFMDRGGRFELNEDKLLAVYQNLKFPIFSKERLSYSVYALEQLPAMSVQTVKEFQEKEDHFIVKFNDGTNIKFDLPDEFLDFWDILTEYKDANVSGKTVVDIGAYKGDSILLFSRMGAKNIIAFEPVQKFFLKAQKNAELNGILKDRLALFHNAVGGDVFGYEEHRLGNEKDVLISFEEFRSIIKKIGLTKEWVLKIDCEGCEFDFLKGDHLEILINDGLREIILEYHNDDRILEVLEKFKENSLKVLSIVKKEKDCGVLHAVSIL